MNNKTLTILFTLLTAIFAVNTVSANDGVYFTSGNFLVPVKETDISVKKEILTITLCNDGYADVDVDYTFYNNTDVEKNVTMAFEASAPYNTNEKLNRKGEHPCITDFTVEMNGTPLAHRNALVAIHYGPDKREVDFTPLDMTQWKGIGEVPDSILPTDDAIYNEALDSVAAYAYAYYFDATFKPGINKVHHTYRYKKSFRVGVKFEVPYWLTPITRWANGQADDFTLRVKAEDFTEILMTNEVFKDSKFTQVGSTSMPVYYINDEFRGRCVYATVGPDSPLEWHSANFRPKENMCIESGDAIYPVMRQYAIDGKVVTDKNGMKYRYLATTDDGYLVEAQDLGIIPKEGTKLEHYEAEKGQGVVYLNDDTQAANVRVAPSLKSKVLCVVKDEPGELPTAYPCLGYVGGKDAEGNYKFWFKIKVNGKVGYISRDITIWDTICTF